MSPLRIESGERPRYFEDSDSLPEGYLSRLSNIDATTLKRAIKTLNIPVQTRFDEHHRELRCIRVADIPNLLQLLMTLKHLGKRVDWDKTKVEGGELRFKMIKGVLFVYTPPV